MYGQTYDFTTNITGTVNIEAESNIKNILIYNTTEQIIYSKDKTGLVSAIDLTRRHAPLQKGIYFINIKTKNGNFVKKLIIQ